MVEINGDMKTVGIAINMQRVFNFNPLVEAGTLRLQDSQFGNFNHGVIDDLNVSVVF